MTGSWNLFVLSWFFLASLGLAQPPSHPTQDYTLMWWADGWRGRSEEGRKILNLQTNRYGLSLDVEKIEILHLGILEDPLPYTEAAAEPNDRIEALPAGELELVIEEGTRTYRCVGADPSASQMGATQLWEGDSASEKPADLGPSPVRIIDSGRFVQRFDVQYLIFRDDQGKVLPALGRLEVTAWPDRITFELELTAQTPLSEFHSTGRLTTDTSTVHEKIRVDGMKTGADRKSLFLSWKAAPEKVDPQTPSVRVDDLQEEEASWQAQLDPNQGWHRIDLQASSKNAKGDPDQRDRYALSVTNPADSTRTVRLFFNFEGPGVPPITGLSPILLDEHGEPSGIPVQISKNWHRRPDQPALYEGPWFHGYTVLHLGPGETWKGQLVIATAHWGGVPAASHAQLCLIGWGTHQLWDQVAIGSWGESITYDPDVNLNRSMIDDVRPLMVWGMREEPESKWTWTNNVGGGDFLVYFNDRDEKQFLTRMKTAYERYCPNLTQVVYSGISADGAIRADITVSTPRCDDLNRAFHQIHYEVLKPVSFSRLAFYQVGADGYNNHRFERLARGDRDGLVEEWGFTPGGKKYDRKGVACENEGPWWFSLHEAVPHSDGDRNPRGAWANRGLVVRSWNARLGGQSIPRPFVSFYGTENGGIPSMNVELSPPPDLDRLEPGDFVTADLELVVMPLSAEDYYGPNTALEAALERDGNTWKMVYREAAGNDLKVDCREGKTLREYPLTLALDKKGVASFEVQGGVGFVPFVFTGLDRPAGYRLEQRTGEGEWHPLDQSVHGKDFWQTDYDDRAGSWVRTYNVSLDGEKGKTRRFRFHKEQD
jgi:hypothetical protein